jgi:hypothetical protein
VNAPDNIAMREQVLGLNLNKRCTRMVVFLDEMNLVVPWTELLALIAPHAPRAKTGRPPLEVETMLRIHFFYQWFGLPNLAMEEALFEMALYREFVGLSSVHSAVFCRGCRDECVLSRTKKASSKGETPCLRPQKLQIRHHVGYLISMTAAKDILAHPSHCITLVGARSSGAICLHSVSDSRTLPDGFCVRLLILSKISVYFLRATTHKFLS